MSTIVTQVDHRSFYTTLVPKTYQCYEARSISTSPLTTPALTESDQKPKHQKLHASSLPPPNRAEKAASAKTPLRAEAVGQTKPVESVPTIATDVLCGDVPKKSLRSEVFTPNVKRVLDYMADPTADEGHKEFHGVRPAEFRLIHEAGEAGRILTKPRLAYDYDKHILSVDMPSFLHEAAFDYLKCHLTLAIAQLPYDPELVETTISMNYPLKIGGSKIVNPDMTITISAVDDAPSVVLVPAIGECAFSQNRDKVFKRMEDEIEAHPDAVLAIIVLVREGIHYTCPNADSIASKELRNREDDPQSLTLDEFISQRTTPRSFDTPIRVGEHDWCHIQSVEYFVWVKGDHQDRINVRNYDPQFMAHGTLAPNLNMDAVTAMLERGVRKIRDCLVSFSRELSEDVDCSELENAEVRQPIVWRLGAKNVMKAADLTAHQRYDLWHDEVSKGVKRSHDESYEPTESECSSSDSEISATVSSQDSLAQSLAGFKYISLETLPHNVSLISLLGVFAKGAHTASIPVCLYVSSAYIYLRALHSKVLAPNAHEVFVTDSDFEPTRSSPSLLMDGRLCGIVSIVYSFCSFYEEFFADGGTGRCDGDTPSNSIYAGREGHGSRNGTPRHSLGKRSKDGRDLHDVYREYPDNDMKQMQARDRERSGEREGRRTKRGGIPPSQPILVPEAEITDYDSAPGNICGTNEIYKKICAPLTRFSIGRARVSIDSSLA
ncbi:hypothetical protein EV424DRAFT_1615238 [Suillus variegatus]|nr:hypothetical protein EV424DRAFT_1615238 [Suillus variegatus]